MKDFKKIFARSALVFEFLLFFYFYLFGSYGLKSIKIYQNDIKILQDKILNIEIDIKNIKDQLDDLNNFPYYKEKVARDELQMALKTDEIYID